MRASIKHAPQCVICKTCVMCRCRCPLSLLLRGYTSFFTVRYTHTHTYQPFINDMRHIHGTHLWLCARVLVRFSRRSHGCALRVRCCRPRTQTTMTYKRPAPPSPSRLHLSHRLVTTGKAWPTAAPLDRRSCGCRIRGWFCIRLGRHLAVVPRSLVALRGLHIVVGRFAGLLVGGVDAECFAHAV